jgi:hypothetical protein
MVRSHDYRGSQVSRLNRHVRISALGILVVSALGGCAVSGGGYDGDVGVSVGYYEPFGYDYGGWGSGYHVGPAHGGERRPEQAAAGHNYRPAASSRRTPSIPTRPRNGR